MTLRTIFPAGLLAACLSAGAGLSQVAANPAVSAGAGQTKTAPLPSTLPKSQIHPASRPPMASRVPAAQRLSTAQRMAIVGDGPAPKVLPAVTASDAAGRRVAAHSTTAARHWLLLYREQNCAPCDRLLNVLAASQSPHLKKGLPYVVLVASHQAAAAEQVRVRYGTLSDATWLTDRERQFATLVKPHGTPTLYAMEGDRVVWMASGTESNPQRVEARVSAWLADMAAQDAVVAKAPAAPTTSAGAGAR